MKLLAGVGPGPLDGFLAPLRKRIEHILANERLSGSDVTRRVRILSMGSRTMPPDSFTSVATSRGPAVQAAEILHRRVFRFVWSAMGSRCVWSVRWLTGRQGL